MLKASVVCGFVVMLLSMLYLFMREQLMLQAFDVMTSMIIWLAPIMWFVGFGFCLVLLLPLLPVFKKSSLVFSLFVFAAVGFLIPALIDYQFMQFPPHHGKLPAVSQSPQAAWMSAFFWGLVGAAGALTAWLSLWFDRKEAS